MPRYANQKSITIHRAELGYNFISLNREAFYKAAKELSGNDFKLWVYLCSNADGYTLDFSPAHIQSILGISRADRSLKKLEELGYVQSVGNNHYNFYMIKEELNE